MITLNNTFVYLVFILGLSQIIVNTNLSAQNQDFEVPCPGGQIAVDLRKENEPALNVNNLQMDILEQEGTCDWIGIPKVNGCPPYSACQKLCTPGNHYTVYPYDYILNDEDYAYYINGVTMEDVTLLSHYFFFGGWTPYQRIASDANYSGLITTYDIVEIRKLVLGLYTKLPDSPSWRYVDREYIFPTLGTNEIPGTYPQTVTVIAPVSGIPVARFIAVKVGDVNGSVMPCEFFTNPPIPDKSYKLDNPVKVDISSFSMDDFGNIKVPVRYDSEVPLLGIQLGLKFDSKVIDLLDISSGEISIDDCFGIGKNDGELKFLWVAASPSQVLQKGQTLFTLNFKIKKKISTPLNFITFDSGIIANEAVDIDLNKFNVLSKEIDSKSNNTRTEKTYTICDIICHPNPTTNSFTLSFESDIENQAEISTYSLDGRKILVKDVYIQKGKNDVYFTLPEVITSGIYVWEVKSNNTIIKGQIVKI